MGESELYKELGILTRDKDKWQDSIPYIAALLSHESLKIQFSLTGYRKQNQQACRRDCLPVSRYTVLQRGKDPEILR